MNGIGIGGAPISAAVVIFSDGARKVFFTKSSVKYSSNLPDVKRSCSARIISSPPGANSLGLPLPTLKIPPPTTFFYPKYKGRAPKNIEEKAASVPASTTALLIFVASSGRLIPLGPKVKLSGSCAKAISTNLS